MIIIILRHDKNDYLSPSVELMRVEGTDDPIRSQVLKHRQRRSDHPVGRGGGCGHQVRAERGPRGAELAADDTASCGISTDVAPNPVDLLSRLDLNDK